MLSMVYTKVKRDKKLKLDNYEPYTRNLEHP